MVAGKRIDAQANTVVRHTVCEPGEIAFEVKSGGILGKAETMRVGARGGQAYKLTKGPAGEVKVEVAPAAKR